MIRCEECGYGDGAHMPDCWTQRTPEQREQILTLRGYTAAQVEPHRVALTRHVEEARDLVNTARGNLAVLKYADVADSMPPARLQALDDALTQTIITLSETLTKITEAAECTK
jgi:endonuclease/exonuclease/phosphatase (EEP) superfamily protein YafD